MLASVILSTPDGDAVTGTLAADQLSWSSQPTLGYGRTYTITAVATNPAGQNTESVSTFTTLTPRNKVLATAYPLNGATVGVGQPIAVYFDEKVPDRAAMQQRIAVTTTPAQPGAFYWFSDREVHWRPKEFFLANTAVSVDVMIYGHDLGGGLYGQADKHFAFTVGRSLISEIDNDAHTMVVKQDGEIVQTMPVSLGNKKYPTYNGIHIVAEKYDKKIMDSSTWGLTGAGAYKTEVKWAVRISSTGEFVHAAPWSVWAQGSQNVSHGCVNVSTENAKWFYDTALPGDPVIVSNTSGTPLQPWDGFGDWQISWEDYSANG